MGSSYRGEPRALEDGRLARPPFTHVQRLRRPPAARPGIRNASTTTRVAALVLALVCLGLLIYLLVLAAGPSISDVSPSPNSTAAPGTVTIGAMVSSNAKPIRQILLIVDGAAVQPAVQVRNDHLWLVNFAAEFARGAHSVRLQVTDTAGHTDEHSWSFQAAGPLIAPTLAYTGPPGGETLAAGPLRISLQVVADGDLSTVDMTVNGQETPASFAPDPAHVVKLGNGSEGQSWSVFSDPTLAAGDYLVHVTAKDVHGNVSSSDLRFSVASDPSKATARFFSATDQYIHGPFKTYWEAHDGAFLFGNPLSPELVNDKGVTVQYFERARFETGPNGAVALGLLGEDALHTSSPKVENPGNPATLYFPETGHTVSGIFRQFWEQHGGIQAFGFPISEPINEGGVQVQYFERVRLELHPAPGGTSSTVQISDLGTQAWAVLSGPSE